jgi:pentatricopeptide repeat protein
MNGLYWFASNLGDAIFAVRSELFLFCLAFALHHFLLGSWRPRKSIKSSKEKFAGKDKGNYSKVELDDKDSCKDPDQVLQISQAAFDRGDHRAVLRYWSTLRSSSIMPALHLAQIVESMQRFKKDSSTILAEVTAYLKRNAGARNAEYINRLLEPLAKSLDVEVVEGLVNLLPSFGVQANSLTFEILVSMRFSTRSFEEISTLSKQMVKVGVTPSMRTLVMLLKTAVQTGKLEEALERYRAISSKASPETPSEAPSHIAVQLVELACRQHQPEVVLPDLEKGTMALTTEMVNLLLSESSRARNPELSARIEALAARLSIGRDGRTYQALVRSAGPDSEKISSLLDEMSEKKIVCTQEVANMVLSMCGQSGDTMLADRLYALLGSEQQSQSTILQAFIRFYAEAGQPEKSCEIFQSHLRATGDRRVVLESRTEKCLVGAALQCGRQDVAAAVLESAPSDTAKHISIIRGCASRGNLKEAMAAFRSLQASGADITQSLWNTALDACVENRDLDQAFSLMKEIEAAGAADAVTYNTLIKTYLRNERYDGARSLMAKMRKAGIPPNHVTYNELINALVHTRQAQNLQSAWDVVDEMKRDGVAPNRVTCSILLKSLHAKSQQSSISRTMELTRLMQEPIDEVLMSSVMEACVRIGKPALLSQKLQELHREGGIIVNGAQTFGSLIKAYGHANDVDGAWRCWKEMRSRHVKPTSVTIGCMVEAVATSGDVDGAYELIGTLLEDGNCKDQVNAVIFGSVLKGYGRMRRMERVWAVWKDMLSRDIQPSVVTFNAVIDACARSSRMDAVPELLREMAKRKIVPNLITYSTMIKGFSQQKDMRSALSTLQDLRKTSDLKPDGIVYNTLLDGCAQSGLIVEGERLFTEMQQEGVVPTNYTLTVVVRLMSQARRADKAFEYVESLTRKHRFRANSHVSNALIQACIASRDLHRGMTVFENMATDRQLPDTRTRHSLTRGLLAAGLASQAAKVIRAVLSIGIHSHQEQTQSGWSSQDDALLGEVLGALSAQGSACADVARQLLAEVRNLCPKAHVDANIAKRLAAA